MAERSNMRNQGLRGELRLREPMAKHVSWRAGGVAARAYFPADLDDLREFLAGTPAAEPVLFVGLGSNLLVRDGGFRGTVVFTHRALRTLRLEASGEIYAEAGVASPKVARFAAMHSLAGAEFLAGIPGTVGGALAMNAGCYGGETWAIVARVHVLDRFGRLHERLPTDYRIAYRSVTSAREQSAAKDGLSDGSEAAVECFAAAYFSLAHGDSAVSRRTIKELLERRIGAQPLNLPNAGSVFRNPGGQYAAQLIESCGLKGRRVGGAEISRKHANFIVNVDRASAADIEALIELAQDGVKTRFGITLQREVRIVGDAADREVTA